MPQSERERRYRAIVESAVDFAIIATDVDGLITDWNQGAEKVLGWSAETMCGGLVDRIFTPEDRSADRPALEMRRALAEGRASDERWHLRQNGERFWASGEMTPLRAEDGAHLGYVKVLRDRTAQHEAAEAHRVDAEFLHSVLASSGDCIKVLDLDANLTFMSEGGQAIMEVSDFNAIRGCPWPDFWQGAGNVAAKNAIAAARSGKTGRFQGNAPTLKGSSRWWDVQVTPIFGADGKPEKLLSISRDITQSKLAEAALRDSEQRWHDTFDQLAEGFVLGELVRGADGAVTDWRYLDVNPAWGELVGVPPEDARGSTIRQIFPGVEDEWIAEVARVVEQRKPAVFTRQVGAIGRWYEGRTFPLEGDRFAVLFLEITAKRRAEEQLRLSELELRSFAQALPNHVWAATPDGEVSWFNDRVYAYCGEGFETLRGQGWLKVVHPNDVDMASEGWKASLASGQAYETEIRIRSAKGDYRWHLVRAVSVINSEGKVLRWVGANTDIHDQKVSEAESVQDRDRLWMMTQDLMMVCDYEGRVTAINPTAQRMLGWESEDIVGHLLSDFLHPDDLNSTVAELNKLSTGATVLAFENRYRTKGGDYRLLAWSAVPAADRVHGVGRDVTDERRLAKDRDRIWTLSPVLKLVATTEGEIIAVNPAWTNALGWSREETIGQNVIAFVAPQNREAAVSGLEQLASGEPVIEFETVFSTKAGGLRRISWTTVPEGGTLYGFGRDITVETEAAEALTKTEEALRQSQKMEAVGQLTGGIAHDFNNLLTGITGSLELLQTRITQGRIGELDKYVSSAQGAARRAAALTHRLLAFSRRQTLAPQPTAVNQLVSGMQDLVSRTVGPAVDVEFVGAVGLWNTLVDQSQLENALLNLCINARDAMPDGGKLTIETANRWIDRHTAAERDLPPGQYLSLCVSDTGTGMPASVVAKAFDPFFTTKPIGQGTGLGLSMIYGFARQSNGQVRIYSEVGQGTMVCIYLPRHLGEAEQAEVAPELSSAPRADQGETVLIVDDEPTVRMLVTEVLEELGYTAIEAADGAGGLQVLQSNARIDLLVTDVGLPGGMNGRQVADAARVARPDLKVLFITGYAENAVLSHGHLDPGMHVLTKPFSLESLAGRIRELINA